MSSVADPHLVLDRVLDALGSEYRRRLLFGLLEDGRQDAAAVRRETGGPDADEEQVRIVAHHVHLPKLEDLGYVTWDRDDGTIERGPTWGEVEPLLRHLRDNADDLPEYWPIPV